MIMDLKILEGVVVLVDMNLKSKNLVTNQEQNGHLGETKLIEMMTTNLNDSRWTI